LLLEHPQSRTQQGALQESAWWGVIVSRELFEPGESFRVKRLPYRAPHAVFHELLCPPLPHQPDELLELAFLEIQRSLGRVDFLLDLELLLGEWLLAGQGSQVGAVSG
jgi:hypothetical protein